MADIFAGQGKTRASHRFARLDALWRLSTRLPGDDLGKEKACAAPSVDAEWFFPVSKEDTKRIEVSKRICSRCPVRSSCREWAMAHEQWGTWGGLTEWEREDLRQEQRRGPAQDDDRHLGAA